MRSGFGPEAALEMHKQLYKQKLDLVRAPRRLQPPRPSPCAPARAIGRP